jgi:hypothetical protein
MSEPGRGLSGRRGQVGSEPERHGAFVAGGLVGGPGTWRYTLAVERELLASSTGRERSFLLPAAIVARKREACGERPARERKLGDDLGGLSVVSR